MNEEKIETPKGYDPAPKLDLSLVKNLTAAEEKGAVSKKVEKQIESASKPKASKFCFIEDHEVNLPTGGYLYQDCDDEEVRHGTIRLKPMTLADESILINQSYRNNGTVFRRLFDNCIVNDFDAKKLNPYDVFFLLYQLREITYGGDYKFNLTCPECGHTYEEEVDIHEVEFEQLTEEDNETAEKTAVLPVSKYTVTLKAATLGDEEEAAKIERNYKNVNKVIMNYVVRTVEILDEEGDPVNPVDYADFYNALPGKDVQVIMGMFKRIDEMKIPTFNTCCPECGHSEDMQIPIAEGFIPN